MRPKQIETAEGTAIVFSPGIYWRGWVIDRPAYSVDVLPGRYWVPFSFVFLRVRSHVERVTIDFNVWVWTPGIWRGMTAQSALDMWRRNRKG